MSNIDKAIKLVLQETFYEISNVYNEHKVGVRNANTNNSKSHIVFPIYKPSKSNDPKDSKKKKYKTRISEQELRFIFVEQLNKYADNNNLDLYYSVETPTKKAYVFSKDKGGPKVVGETDKAGVSARTDLAIYTKIGNEFKLGALIEFKAHNPDAIDYRKDICKLINEESENGCTKYFIQIINVKNQKKTLNNIVDDKIIDIDSLKEKGKGPINYCINYIGFNLYSKTRHKFIIGKIKNNKLEYKECESLSTAESTR